MNHNSLQLFCCEERLLSADGTPPPTHLTPSVFWRAGSPLEGLSGQRKSLKPGLTSVSTIKKITVSQRIREASACGCSLSQWGRWAPLGRSWHEGWKQLTYFCNMKDRHQLWPGWTWNQLVAEAKGELLVRSQAMAHLPMAATHLPLQPFPSPPRQCLHDFILISSSPQSSL